MKTYRVSSIRRKAERIPDGHLYLEDCIALSSEWNEAENRATFTNEAVREIKDTWEPETKRTGKTHAPCKNCGGM